MGGLRLSDYNRGNRPARPQPQNARYGSAQPRRAPAQRPGQRPAQPVRRPAARPGMQQNRPASVRPRGAAPAQGGNLLPKGFLPLAGVCVLILLAGLVLQGLMPDGFALVTEQESSPRTTQMVTEIHSHGPVRINEIMTSNNGVLTDESSQTPDWVEVTNISNSPVNMKGYVLARNSKAGNVFIFPDMTLQPQESVLVYADSHLSEEAGHELHAPFRLSSTGDILMLFNQADVAIDTVNIPALAENTVYARTGPDTWEVSDKPTPGRMNTEEDYRALTTITGDSPVQLVEVVSSGGTYGPDENGVCHDYVILRNVTGADVDLSGWYLSDVQQIARMWRFPDGIVVPAGGTLLVHCSGLNRLDNPAHLHTNFKLSSEGELVMLSDATGQPRDIATFDLLKKDTAWVRGGDGNWSVGTPSAQQAATTTTQ